MLTPPRTGRNWPLPAIPAIFVLAVGTGPAQSDPSIGQFELKTLESAPGYLEFQSQNAFTFGQPRREAADAGGEIIYGDNAIMRQRQALEMELGFTRHLKMRVGIEFEQEGVDEPTTPSDANRFAPLKLDEIGAELVTVFIPRDGNGFGLGAVVEVERPLEAGEQMSLYAGPIVEYAAGPWLFAAIPMLAHNFGGEGDEDGHRDDKWDFAYAAKAAYAFSETLTLAIEGYGTVERLGTTGHRNASARLFGDHDQHRIGPILYISHDLGRSLRSNARRDASGAFETSELTLGVGLLAGLNEATPDATLKLSLEIDF